MYHKLLCFHANNKKKYHNKLCSATVAELLLWKHNYGTGLNHHQITMVTSSNLQGPTNLTQRPAGLTMVTHKNQLQPFSPGNLKKQLW